ncbi:MAG: LL-diaminopimelate aminotransferase [Deltaproteobacteria bacterium]|nr:LL-diaminopimelate aminotransferase [Deltaproteobacteria bacterium]
MDIAQRVKELPPYLFKEIDKQKQEAVKAGADVINLGVGDPDLPTPNYVIEALNKAAVEPANHRYPSYAGMEAFNKEAALWLKKRFNINIKLDEIITLIGSKEGIAHTPLAFINPGDIALIPDPAYPVYENAVRFAGGVPFYMPLKKENDFLPDLDAIPKDIAQKAKLIFLNYPNNPTSATAELSFFNQLVSYAKKYNIIVCHDAAYTEIYYNGKKPASFLEAEGAKEVGIEYHSLSKTYNMTGWRIGFAAGGSDIINALGKIKSNVDSGVFQAIQIAGIAALKSEETYINRINEIYEKRKKIILDALNSVGIKAYDPKTTFYIWFEVPKGYTSAQFVSLLLSKAHIVTIPGNGFGKAGEGYARIALTVSEERIKEAALRIENAKF